MAPQPTATAGTAEAVAYRTELLGRLGLGPAATYEDAVAAHAAFVTVLERAPESQRAWAESQVEEAEAVLSLLDDLDDAVPVRAAAPAAAPVAKVPAKRRWIAVGVVVAVLAAAVGIGIKVQNDRAIPAFEGTPDPTTSASAAPQLDTAAVGAAMKKLAANPKDGAALSDLAGLYFQAQDYKTSAEFSTKLLAVIPKDDQAMVNLGAAYFNLGKTADAEKNFKSAIAVNPKNAEAYYDLGFLYLSQSKPDMAKAKAAWQKVVEIDPKSDIAKNVSTHLKGLASAAASPAPAK